MASHIASFLPFQRHIILHPSLLFASWLKAFISVSPDHSRLSLEGVVSGYIRPREEHGITDAAPLDPAIHLLPASDTSAERIHCGIIIMIRRIKSNEMKQSPTRELCKVASGRGHDPIKRDIF